MAFVDNFSRVFLVLGFSRERKRILRLSIGNFVDPEPLICRANQSGQMPLNILDIVQAISERIGDIDDDDLPIGLALVEERHDAEHLDLFDLTNVTHVLANLAHVERVVVALRFRLRVELPRVFPGLSVKQ